MLSKTVNQTIGRREFIIGCATDFY